MLHIDVLKQLMKESSIFDCFTVETVGTAPDSPGIYAWYSSPTIGKADWDVIFEDGEDIGSSRLRQSLSRHSERHSLLPLNVDAVAGFSATFKGLLEDTSYFVKGTDGQDTTIGNSNLQEILSAPVWRGVLVQALMLSTVFFASPIYIGVAKSLQNRLGQHARKLLKLTDGVKNDQTKRENLLKRSENTPIDNAFAARAVGKGFSPENLIVVTMRFDQLKIDGNAHSLSEDDLRCIAEAAEWLLNRWHRPVLGVR
jgi:hypothetical protein